MAAGFTPLSVRRGGYRKRLAWHIRLLREAIALKLAPWLEHEDDDR